MPEQPTTTVHPITIAEGDIHEASERLVKAAIAEIASAQQDAFSQRRRADKLSQILVGAAGLADAVLRHEHKDARKLARMVNLEIAKVQTGGT